MIDHLPSRYIFLLRCCDKCTSSVQKGESIEPVTWYVGGPPITTLPFPAKDEKRPAITRLYMLMLIILNVLNQ